MVLFFSSGGLSEVSRWLRSGPRRMLVVAAKAKPRNPTGRKQSLETMVEKAGDAAMARLGTSTNTPRSGAQDREWQDLIEAALGGLNPAYRTVIVLRDVEGLAYDEIASMTRLPLGTVKSRLHKGRAMLQRILGQYR